MKRKTIVLAALLLSAISSKSQLTFTGGPLNKEASCLSLWARSDSALMGFDKNLYRTIDGGQSWEVLANGIPLGVDPRTIEYSNGVLIVGTNRKSRIYISTDFGDSFTGGTGAVTSILIPTASTSGPGISMIGGTNSGPHKYDFGIQDWVSSGVGGITHGMAYLGGDTVWECTGGVSSGTTRYSHDNGANWTAVTAEPNTDVGGGVILASVGQDFVKAGNRVIVGTNLTGFPVLYTDDYGVTWQPSNLPSTTYSDYGKRFVKVNDNHLITCNVSGIWKSIDRGVSWTLIQSLPSITTMVQWKGSNLLVAATSGVYEYSNYGDGILVKKHGAPGSALDLIEEGGRIITATANGVFEYSSGNWQLLTDTAVDGSVLKPDHINLIKDTLFVCGSGIFASSDKGQTFFPRSNSYFAFEKPNIIAQFGGKKFVGTRQYYPGGGTPKSPKIWYSSDDGVSYTEATFTNNIGYGLGAAGDNYVQQFYETPNVLVADMNAGYALSADGGINWTYSGGAWDNTYMTTFGNDIYRFIVSGFWQDQKALEVSTDDGASWTTVPLSGLPNSGGSNYKGYYGIWNVDGDLLTYNAHESSEGFYKYEPSNSQWSFVAGSNGPLWDGVTHVIRFNGDLYANWAIGGTWSTGISIGLGEIDNIMKLSVYPNPSSGILNVVSQDESIEGYTIINQMGQEVQEEHASASNIQMDLTRLKRGVYILMVKTTSSTYTQKLFLH